MKSLWEGQYSYSTTRQIENPTLFRSIKFYLLASSSGTLFTGRVHELNGGNLCPGHIKGTITSKHLQFEKIQPQLCFYMEETASKFYPTFQKLVPAYYSAQEVKKDYYEGTWDMDAYSILAEEKLIDIPKESGSFTLWKKC